MRYPTNATPDLPDTRDRFYEPALIPLKPEIPYPKGLYLLDQGDEGACTGFALAAVINLLMKRAGRDVCVSPRMLYEMAKRCDEWPGQDYEGTSLRGAIRGWKNMGVCPEESWPHNDVASPRLSIKRAREARENTIGAYYRVRPVISDFHAALNEVGAIVATAKVHDGWDYPEDVIEKHDPADAAHAFAIVGYNRHGFWVQNSWDNWGNDDGVALWTYEDWVDCIMDAWVVRLALPTPEVFGRTPINSVLLEEQSDAATKSATNRHVIAGHFVHIDDGKFAESGKYWSNADDIRQTAELVAESGDYDHLLFYAHGGLNAPKASARRIESLKDGFKRNRIYPFHFMYDTGLAEELKDVITRKGAASRSRVGSFFDKTDDLIEGYARKLGTIVWDEMKADARRAFADGGAGTECVTMFVDAMAQAGKKKMIHLVGHSTGAILLGHLLEQFRPTKARFENCFLLAPACTVDMYHSLYLPVLRNECSLEIGGLNIYNLTDDLEQDDNVIGVYRKSLLYLVSNAFERGKEKPILGMAKFTEKLDAAGEKTVLHYSNGEGDVTASTTHGGFDNDPATMNHILTTVLGGASEKPFTKAELEY